MMLKLVESAEIGRLMKQMDENRLRYKELKRLHSATGEECN